MKYTEILTRYYDNEEGRYTKKVMLVCLTDVSTLETKAPDEDESGNHVSRRPLTANINSSTTSPPIQDRVNYAFITMSNGNGHWVYDKSYDEMKRLLTAGSNIVQTGVRT